MPPLLSLCMIVRDESACLARCLASVRGLVDEMIVVDTGSTDGTQEIARAAGAKLIQSTWTSDFSAARNQSLEAATGRWILVLDADEVLCPEGALEIRSLLGKKSPEAPLCAYTLINCSTQDGGRTGLRARLIRLFPNHSELRYEWPVHEQLATSLMRLGMPTQDITAEILHDGYSDPMRNQAKQRRNISILKAQIAGAAVAGAMTWFLLGGAHLDLDEVPQALEAYFLASQVSAQGSDLQFGARVRIAACLVRLNLPSQALELASDPALHAHPDFSLACLRAELAEGRPERIEPWLERILDSGTGPFFPPANPAMIASLALQELGRHWSERGRMDLATASLRLAVEALSGRLPQGFRPPIALIPRSWVRS